MNEGWVAQMRKGIAELCVLAVLSGQEAYGYEIQNTISKRPSLAVKESTLYLLLGRLQKDGFVTCRTARSDKGPPRRYFRLTATGRDRLADMSAFWGGFSADVSQLVSKGGGQNG